MTPVLERRRVATEATLARYRNKRFSWSRGITCVHLARFHMRNMGHRPPGLPRFRSAIGAKKALAERGWSSVTDMLDQLLTPIKPAEMALGDIAVIPGLDEDEGGDSRLGLDAILICAGPRALIGWGEDDDKFVTVLDVHLDRLSGAWRV